MTYSCGEGLLTGLIVTGVSNAWSFVNQKVVSQLPSLQSRFQRLSFFLSALQNLYVNELSFCWNHLVTRLLNILKFYSLE